MAAGPSIVNHSVEKGDPPVGNMWIFGGERTCSSTHKDNASAHRGGDRYGCIESDDDELPDVVR